MESLYDLKQASRGWNKKFLTKFKQIHDPYVFVCFEIITLVIFVGVIKRGFLGLMS